MAIHSVATGEIGAHGKTLVASTVDTVTFTEDVSEVTIISDGADAIFYTVDGSTPTVNGANCYMLPAAVSSDTRTVRGGVGTTIKLISVGTPKYSVQREN